VRQVPLSLDKIVDKFPKALSQVVDKALAKDPAERWQSVAEMGAALKELIGSDRMLPPSELSKRARRRWYKRGAVGCGLVTIGLLVALSLGVSAWELIASGPRPAVDLMAPAIPEVLLDSATTLGLLQEGDTARYVFVPAEGSMKDAVVMTSTHLSRIYQGAPRRWELNPDDNYRLNLTNKGGYFIIISADGVHTDTLYHTLRGKEATVLRGALTEVLEGK
jgi:hypothetical protein